MGASAESATVRVRSSNELLYDLTDTLSSVHCDPSIWLLVRSSEHSESPRAQRSGPVAVVASLPAPDRERSGRRLQERG